MVRHAMHDLGMTSFVGRAESLAEGRRLLGSARLVTLVGPGGVGKTRLARRLADDVDRAFPDGTFLVEVAELRDAHALAPLLATTLGIEDVSRSPEAAIVAFVRDRRALLVLDNCEHLVEACASLVHTLLSRHRACGCWPPAASPSAWPASSCWSSCPSRCRPRRRTPWAGDHR